MSGQGLVFVLSPQTWHSYLLHPGWIRKYGTYKVITYEDHNQPWFAKSTWSWLSSSAGFNEMWLWAFIDISFSICVQLLKTATLIQNKSAQINFHFIAQHSNMKIFPQRKIGCLKFFASLLVRLPGSPRHILKKFTQLANSNLTTACQFNTNNSSIVWYWKMKSVINKSSS